MKQLFLLAIIVILVPQLALAAWWNPFSWSKQDGNKNVSQVSNKTDSTFYRFYVTNKANIRSCPNFDCPVIKQVDKGQYFDFSSESKYSSSAFLPDWVSVSYLDGVTKKYGFINKNLLTVMLVSPEVEKDNTIQVKQPREINKTKTTNTTSQVKEVDNVLQTPEKTSSGNQTYSQNVATPVNDNLPRCGSTVYNQCPYGYVFYCEIDGVGHCKQGNYNQNNSQNNTYSTPQLNSVTNSNSEFDTNKFLLSFIEKNWNSGIYRTDDEGCQILYNKRFGDKEDKRFDDVKFVYGKLLTNCMKPTGPIPTQTNREVCNSQYDPVTKTMILQNCKSW